METISQKTSFAEIQSPDIACPQDSKHVQYNTSTTLDGYLNTESHDMSALRHKVDRRIIPIMLLCYFTNFLDKVALNVGSETLDGQSVMTLTW